MVVRTFEERATEILTSNSPFRTIEEYTEWYLERKALDLTQEAIHLEQSYRQNFYQEVYLAEAIKEEQLNTVYDPTELIVDEISFKDFGDEKMEADEFHLRIGDRIESVGMSYQIIRNPY